MICIQLAVSVVLAAMRKGLNIRCCPRFEKSLAPLGRAISPIVKLHKGKGLVSHGVLHHDCQKIQE